MLASRPRTLIGLALRAAALHRVRLALVSLVVVLAALAPAAMIWRGGASDVRVATFNIENFPRDARQVEAAFTAIAALDAPIVAVQEITDLALFADAARVHLGADWRFVHDASENLQRVGVLYDASRFTVTATHTHPATQLEGRGKPTLEVRLSRVRGAALRVFVVHLKAGGEHAGVRREQLRRLAPLIEDAVASPDDVVLLGDFNSTGDEDRVSLARFARATRLEWASEALACTSYWDRRDGCRGVALDHVLTRRAPRDTAARGPCESIGCAPGRECPVFHREVSDHCPVTADLRAPEW
ncbi:MAG: endonuclease/exonuclease/phosphatase family protein [Sandaracinaceae bacterium]|nr:endonuclease/exonuclease/phosphatase family protein [Sandaracinaceae bacterium]